jgi:hypothetical protein
LKSISRDNLSPTLGLNLQQVDEVIKYFSQNKKSTIYTTHKKIDSEGKYIATENFNLEQQESEGTKKIFNLAGILIDTIKNNKF